MCLDAQSCLILCDPMDSKQPGSPVHGFSRQESWSGLLFPSPGDLPDPGIKLRSSAMQADSLPSEPTGKHQEIEECLLTAEALEKFSPNLLF